MRAGRQWPRAAQMSSSLPSTSYRNGVQSAPLHDLYSPSVTAALRAALARFERSLPGIVCDEAVLYGAETRTSSPVRGALAGAACLRAPRGAPCMRMLPKPATFFATENCHMVKSAVRHAGPLQPRADQARGARQLSMLRDASACESVSHPGLFPAGEGAGYAGGIVSAAVDGAKVAAAVLASLAAV